MRRLHAFEFTDLPWYPGTFRRMQTDYLQVAASMGAGHANLVPLIQKALRHAGTDQIVDLCSGGGGPWLHLQSYLQKAGTPVNILLTDKFPDPMVIRKWNTASLQGLTYLAEPVDAREVPPQLEGMRTLFEGFHHFKPADARRILQDAAEKKAAIGIFEASFKPPLNLFLLVLGPLMTLIGYLLITPFIQPRTWWRCLWTYLIPVVPLATCWDGVISLLRVYSPQELEELVAPLRRAGYTWEIGQAPTGTPVFNFIYFVGYPNGGNYDEYQQ